MAIRIRETANLQNEFDYVCESDDALDRDADGYAERMERFRDGTDSDLPLKDGQEPTIFKLKPIASQRTLSLLADLLTREGAATYYVQSCALGLVSAQNLDVDIKRTRVDGHMQVTDECINQLPGDVLIELGRAVVEHSNPKKS